jgi:L-amino acid N-acyltransferase YncA
MDNIQTAIIREATVADVAALARLHMTTFNETHAPILLNGPTYEVREYQWRQAFQAPDGEWFCFVIASPDGELIGFAKGSGMRTRTSRSLQASSTRSTWSVRIIVEG